jgi:hypothetical protein
MISEEFLCEWVEQGKEGPFGWGIGNHFMDQWHLPERKDITWNQIHHIIKRLPYVKPQLMQMVHFKQFWLRDDVTGIELGCQLKTFGNPETRFVYINTLVNKGESRKNPDNPVIVVNAK